MNPLLVPAELDESECNAQGFYALPDTAFGRLLPPETGNRHRSDEPGVFEWTVSRLLGGSGLQTA